MATLSLNVYQKKDSSKIAKTYTAEGFDLMYGTVEDIMEIIDFNKIHDEAALTIMVLKSFPLLKPFLKEIFKGLTDDELKRTKIKELIPLFGDIAREIGESLSLIQSKN